MWITMTIVFAILLLVCISINSDHAREIQALRYMNDYLLDEVVKTKGHIVQIVHIGLILMLHIVFYYNCYVAKHLYLF
ncbi:DUF1514 family protein [Staphylococcus aureus]|uniref:DUF1514 family protein n=1 Tax=Staphylococcus aureus TaxID=1280 RepID=UPI00210A255F|nr:DUF1514 family protein [Staphylococcus aureus]